MIKNILKKFIVLLGLSFVLLGFNFTNVNAEEIIAPAPLVCVAPQILNEAGDACVDVVVVPEALVCTSPQVEVAGVCTTPVVEPTPAPTPKTTLSINTEVDVPLTCEVSDTDNVNHTYTASSSDSYIGICALRAALDLKSISSVKLSNQYPSMGLFVTSFDNTDADPSSQYWALYKNNGYTDFGISTLPISVGDTISFKLSDFSGVETGDSVLIKVKSLITDTNTNQNSGSGGGSSTPTLPKTFSIPNAFTFLSQNQKNDGSFGSPMYTDWVAIASKAGDNADLKSKLANSLKSNPIDSGVVTDYERRAMALMALGIDPYNGTNVNYIKKIIDSFDGTQFGDESLVNDDIFALIVLKNAGYSGSDEMISKDVGYIVSKQSGGSWGSVDMTGAGIQALRGLESIAGVSDAIAKGESYLTSSQKSDGGFENNSSTSWALQALVDTNSVAKATDYLASRQQSDGGLENTTDDTDTRVWSTAYAIPAILHKSWSEIMNNFSRQVATPAPASSSSSSVSSGQEEIKPIIAPVVAVEEKKEVEVLPKIEDKKIIKIVTKPTIKPIVKTSAIKNTKVEKPIGSPLSASAIGASESNSGFLSIVHNLITKIRAPFAWFLVKLGF